MGLSERLRELGVNKRNAPVASILLPVKALLFMYAVTFMVEKLGPIQIQALGISLYAFYTEGSGWLIGIIANSVANNLFGMERLVEKFLFKTVSDILYITMQVAGATIFFIILAMLFPT
jgi:hypothetical protein